jgi:hypothetical protein
MTSESVDLAAKEHAATAKFDAAKAEYDSALAEIAALHEKRAAEIAALRLKLLNGALPASSSPQSKPNGAQKKKKSLGGKSKTDRILDVLSDQYKKVAQLAKESGLTSDEASHALSQDRIKRMIEPKGKPGQKEYRLKKGVAAEKSGTTEAILSVLRIHPTGLYKKTLTDEVEKLSPSKSKTPRNAIQSTISKMWNEGAIAIDASDVCTVARKEAST